MTAAKRTRPSDDEIVEAYEEWDPNSSTVEEFARSQSISQQGLSLILRRRGIPAKWEQRVMEQAQQAAPMTGRPLAEIDSFIDRMADGVLKAILEENAELKAELGKVGPAVDVNAVRVTLDQLERRIQGLEALVEARFQNVTHLLVGITQQIRGAFPASSDST